VITGKPGTERDQRVRLKKPEWMARGSGKTPHGSPRVRQSKKGSQQLLHWNGGRGVTGQLVLRGRRRIGAIGQQQQEQREGIKTQRLPEPSREEEKSGVLQTLSGGKGGRKLSGALQVGNAQDLLP